MSWSDTLTWSVGLAMDDVLPPSLASSASRNSWTPSDSSHVLRIQPSLVLLHPFLTAVHACRIADFSDCPALMRSFATFLQTVCASCGRTFLTRSEEHTSELQSPCN